MLNVFGSKSLHLLRSDMFGVHDETEENKQLLEANLQTNNPEPIRN